MKPFTKLVVVLAVAIQGVAHADGPTAETYALVRHARGGTVQPSEVKPWLWTKPDLSTWNTFGGSQNKPIIAAAAIGDYHWVASVASLEQREGIFGRELGSPGFYFHMVVAAKMVALRDALKAGATSDADAIRQSLRCVWAYESLVAVDTPRTNTESNLSGTIVRGVGDSATYQGLTTAVAGERWHSDSYTDHDDHGAFLSWALDWTPRRMAGQENLRTRGEWWESIVASLAGCDSYESPAPPEVFGLTQDERAVLTRVVRGDMAAVKQAVAWVGEFGTFAENKIRLRRTTEGTEVVWFSSHNGNKPAHAATSITSTGVWKTIRPSFMRGVGANHGYAVSIDAGIINAECAPGAGVHVSMPELGGAVLWEVMLEGHSVVQTVGGGTPPTPPPAGADAAVIVRHTIPATLKPQQRISVEVVVRNTGTSTWTKAAGFRLGGVGDSAGDAYRLDGSARIDMPEGAAVAPGQEEVFSFELTAPAKPGTLHPSWRMLRERVAWFGDSLATTVDVR